MPSIHPSETPPLGWLVPCLAVRDLDASIDFYGRMDFVRFGGDPSEGWAMLRSRAVEIHLFQGHISADVLNFRGGDPAAIRTAMTERGLAVASKHGQASFTYADPDGREVFFDTSAEELVAYEAGRFLTGPIHEGDVHESDGLDLGNLTCCLACRSLATTSAFYETLGLVPAGGAPEQGWAILGRADHRPSPGTRLVSTYLSLFQDMIPKDMLGLRGGRVAAIAGTLEERGVDLGDGVKIAADGGESLLLTDPDERPILLDTTPPERLYAG